MVRSSQYALCVTLSARTMKDLVAPFNIFPSNHAFGGYDAAYQIPGICYAYWVV